MSVSMKLRVLEEWLQGLNGFVKPKVGLEQYETPAHIASCMTHTMQGSFEDIESRTICDLGAGCGMLSCGAALLEAGSVLALEIDPDALQILSQNVTELEMSTVDAVLVDVFNGISEKLEKKFDTVMMNPPFGTKNNSGVDLEFLKVATKLATTSIYSLHKTTTRNHVMKKGKEMGLKPKVVAELKYDLPSTYKFHKKLSVDIAVDFWRFEIPECSET